uniref:probable E3 ubiquitin-protein ligase HERC4 n=1 Tax=Myxine glutinosa TaxID=7769 RepID=UPI00358F9D47
MMQCWGGTSFGQLGLGGIDEEIVTEPRWCPFFEPGVAGTGSHVKDVGCGRRHTVFLLGDGTIYSCGCNDLGQLGHEKGRKKPEQISALDAQNIVAVACGEMHTLALNDNGQLFAWGFSLDGRLGLSNVDECVRVPRLVKSLSNVQLLQVSCGSKHCLALSNDGQLFSWGSNQYGQLGHGRDTDWTVMPQLLQTLVGIPLDQLIAGGSHSLVLTFSGAVFSWGRNRFGQLGLGDEIDRFYPVLLKSLRTQKVVHVCCGEDHTTALTKEGGVFTFGAGGYGQLGHNSTNHEIYPRKVFELMGSTVTQIACGRQHTLAFVPACGLIYSFGLGGNGQLGIGSTTNRKSPFPVKRSLAPRTQSNTSSDGAGGCVQQSIFAGGDQSFVYISAKNSEEQVDFRVPGKRKRILALTEELFQKWTNENDRLHPETIRQINLILSSPSCLNSSFLACNTDEHYRTSPRTSGVDMYALRQACRLLVRVKSQHVLHEVAASLEKYLIPNLSPSPPDFEAMRLFLMLPEFSFFQDSNSFSTLAIPFAMAIARLAPAPSKVLENWWSALEAPFFTRLVELYKRVLVFLLEMRKLGVPPAELSLSRVSLRSSLIVLSMLHKANTRCSIIQFDKFYIPDIKYFVNIRRDYIYWLQHREDREQDANSLVLTDAPVTLCSYPFVFDAQIKTKLLQTDAIVQMQMAMDEANRRNVCNIFMPVDQENPCLLFIVRRENIVGDTLEILSKQHRQPDFKKPLKVIFLGEEAVDAGGVKKEFFLLIMKDLLHPKYGLFKYYEESRLIWFSPKTFEENSLFNLIGVLCGLAIYNAIIVDLNFPLALYKKLLKVPATLDDLKELMPDVGRSLQQLLDYAGDNVEETFSLCFTTTEDRFGMVEEIELVPGGTNIVVNKSNRKEFVDAYTDYLFNESVHAMFEEFYNGFHKVCGGEVLQLFQPNELMAMVIGNTNYDWEELEKNTEYKGEYWSGHPTIKLFWEVFHELDIEMKKKFLLFLTGSDRIPILGMSSLKIIIQPTGGGDTFLPCAHTCFNLLDLPKFQSKEVLRHKLLLSITHYQGFSLA